MKVDAFNINQIFLTNRVLKIPFFQRGYVWKEANWQQFFDDIASIAGVDEEDDREKYFLGSIIIKEGGSRRFDVIDGQQRLTTIVMFMKALYLCLGRNDLFNNSFMQMSLSDDVKPILVTNYNDQAIYTRILNEEVPKRDPLVPNSRLSECYAYFVRRILDAQSPTDPEVKPIRPTALLDTITDNVRLVVIEVQQGENAQKIFETINCSGIKLTTGEMLKNYLFQESMIAQYEGSWKKVFENQNREYWEGQVLNGRVKDGHIENFFYRYMLIKMQDEDIKPQLSSKDLKDFRQKEGLFEKFRRLMTKCSVTKDAAIKEIVEYAELYLNTFKDDTLEETAVSQPGLKRLTYLMYAQDSWTMTPYILYILKNVDDSEEQSRIFSYMETYLMRRMICKSKNNNYSDMFSENLIGQKVKTYDDFYAYVNDSGSRGALMMPSDTEVLEAIQTKDLKREAQTVLYMLESKINEDLDVSGEDRSINAFFPEQIMPEKPNEAWPLKKGESDEDRKALSRTLGNFVVLTSKLKAKTKVQKWDVKKASMCPLSAQLQINSVLNDDEQSSWERTDILTRGAWLGEQVLGAWSL